MRAENLVPVSLLQLADDIYVSWSRETSASSEWGEQNPALGQCAVTALLLQKLKGGKLLRAIVNGESHYWNLIDDEEIDLTREQFTLPLTIEEPVERERDYVLSFPATEARYNQLLKNFREELREGSL